MMHRLGQYFPDPQDFNPDRWSTQARCSAYVLSVLLQVHTDTVQAVQQLNCPELESHLLTFLRLLALIVSIYIFSCGRLLFTYMPFSMGQRGCMGKYFAQVRLDFAWVVYHNVTKLVLAHTVVLICLGFFFL